MIKWISSFLKKKQKPIAIESTEPEAKLNYANGKLVVEQYNQAFVKVLRQKFSDLVDDSTTDDEVVTLFVQRENLKHEEPRLEVLHLGIEDDGRLKIKLDWNKAFIDLLKENGITNEVEEEAIKDYLSRMTSEVADQIEPSDVLAREAFNDAYKEIDQQTQQELEEAELQAKAGKRKRRRRNSA